MKRDRAGFVEALRADKADTTVRLVYADWLQERSEPQWRPYMWFGRNAVHPDSWIQCEFQCFYWKAGSLGAPKACSLPADWWSLLPHFCQPRHENPASNVLLAYNVEVLAVRAFLRLPFERQAELLDG